MSESLSCWRVDLNECDCAYLIAASEDDAIRIAAADWSNQSGIQPGELDYPESITARPETRIGPNSLGPSILVHLGLVRWECAGCEGYITSGEDAAWQGLLGYCAECKTGDEAGERCLLPGECIQLSTEY